MKENMLRPTSLYDAAKNRLANLRESEKKNELYFKNSPDGKIHVVKTQNRIQYYLRTDPKDKSGDYIQKKEVPKLRKYLQKSYNEKVQKQIQKEIKSIEEFLKHSDDYNQKIQQIYSNNPQEIKSFISPIDCSDADYIEYWENIPYVKNPVPISTAEYKTDNEELVRSKSEMNIANSLKKAGIPYKYECPVILGNGRTLYPDFTILDVKNRREIYWEHRGMMDDYEYIKNAVRKQKEYLKHGIILGKNLIVTEETGRYPLGTDEIQAIICSIK